MADEKKDEKNTNLQSNLANFLQDVGVKNANALKAFQGIGDFLGTVADISGVIGGVIAFGQWLLSLFNQGPDPSQRVLDAITALGQFLKDVQRAEDLEAKLTNLQDELASAVTALQSLPSLAKEQLTEHDVTDELQGPLNSVNKLAPPDVLNLGGGQGAGLGGPWLVPYQLQFFWSDSDSPDVAWPPASFGVVGPAMPAGYGQLAPAQDSLVFNYTFILPQYIRAVAAFLAVGIVIDPNFGKNWGDTVIRPTARLLRGVHDYVRNNGLTKLSPGLWNVQTLASWLQVGSLPGEYTCSASLLGRPSGPTGVFPILNGGSILNGFFIGQAVGVKIEYGAVEKFSGFNSVGMYTFIPPLGLAPTDPRPNGKFQIRLLRRVKDVYIGTGMPDVWNLINQLNAVVGDAPLPAPSFADWSFRKDIEPVAGVTRSDGSLSLRDVQNLIAQTPPDDLPPNTLFTTFRDLLSV